MAVQTIETTGHESLDAVSVTTAGSLASGHILAVVYDDTKSTAELCAALERCKQKLTKTESAVG